jgi:hypothetical protein
MERWIIILCLLMLAGIVVMSSSDSNKGFPRRLESLSLRICHQLSRIFKTSTAIFRESNMTFSNLSQSKVCYAPISPPPRLSHCLTNIIGARAYYFKHILHDWSDENCRVILKHTAAAMERGYSKILIEDYVVPDQNAGVKETLIDMVVMVWCPGIERTRQRWTELLESAGLKIRNFWLPVGYNKGVIEAELEEIVG